MNNNISLVTIIAAVIIAAIVIFGIYLYLKTAKNKKNTDAAQKFLDELKDALFATAENIVDSFDYSKYKNLEDAEKAILAEIYDGAWDYINQILMSSSNRVAKLAAKVLTKDMVVTYLQKLFEELGLIDSIGQKYAALNISLNSEAVVAEDQSLQDEFADQDKYNEDTTEADLHAPEEEEIPDEELAKLNPAQDTDEVVYSDDDESVETVSSTIVMKHDKNGKPLYYENDGLGSLKRVTKSYATKCGLPIIED